MLRNIGIRGLGLWDGPPVGNDHFGPSYLEKSQVKDPYKGQRDGSGVVRIAGLELDRTSHRRTIEAIEQSFLDPYRGTKTRRYFPPSLRVSEAELVAARAALDDAGLSPGDIDLVLVQSFLPDELQPKNAGLIAHGLGITRAPSWDVDTMCNSAVTHLTIAASQIAAGMAQHVLCVQSVAYSRVADPGSSSVIQEGDMASAMVVGPSTGSGLSFSWRTDGRLHAAIRLQWAPPTGAAPRRYWEPAQDRMQIRFDPELQSQVMGEVAHHARIVCLEALDKADLRPDQIDAFVTHQPMSWYGAFLLDTLGLPDGVLCDSFADYANINSACIPASLHQAKRSGKIKPGSRTLIFGPAAGYTFGAVAMIW